MPLSEINEACDLVKAKKVAKIVLIHNGGLQNLFITGKPKRSWHVYACNNTRRQALTACLAVIIPALLFLY